MKNLYYLLLFGMLISCSGNRQADKALLPELDEIDYEVISAAIDLYLDKYKKGSYATEDTMLYKGSGNRFPLAIIIPDSTNIEYLSIWSFDKHKDKGFNDKYLTDRIKSLNKKRYKIEPSKITSIKTYSNIVDSKIIKLEKMYELYSDAWGFVCFSKPSINDNYDLAVIYIEFVKHSKWARGDYLWLKKDNGKWILIDKGGVWES